MKKILISFFIMILVLSSVITIAFTDLSEEHWAYENITTLVEQGVINGYPDGTYRPEETVTKGEYLKLIMTANYSSRFFDMMASDGHWALPYLFMAREDGILMREIVEVQLDEPIARIEMAFVLGCADINIKGAEKQVAENIFSDLDVINNYYQEIVLHTVERGLLTGYPDGTFKPMKNMTRAEVATVINRYINLHK